MYVRVQDENTAIICTGRQIIKTRNTRDMWTWINLIAKKTKMQCQQKCEETKSIPKQMMSENKITSDNFDKVELQVHSHD